MPAGADNVAVNVPSASPRATAACQDPASLEHRRGVMGWWLQIRPFFSYLEPSRECPYLLRDKS